MVNLNIYLLYNEKTNRYFLKQNNVKFINTLCPRTTPVTSNIVKPTPVTSKIVESDF